MSTINSNIHSVKAFAPASCANVAVGFDILGFALEAVGDHVTLTRRDDNKVVIESAGFVNSDEQLPLAVEKNTASVVVQKLCQAMQLDLGFSIRIEKGIPLSSGMGGSAASAVAALTAFNAFLNPALSLDELAQYALLGEEVASGQKHADNVVPCIFGGLTLIQCTDPIAVIQLPIPDVYCVLVHPHLHVSTNQARSILKEQLPLKDYVRQSANLAAFISSLYKNDRTLWPKILDDLLIEPQRVQFVPGFYQIKAAALQAGALGVSFSGSGPSIFAFAENKHQAVMISNAMQEPLHEQGIKTDTWISPISKHPARVIEVKEAL